MIERIIAASVRNRFLVFVFTLFAIAAGIYGLVHTPLDAIPDLSDAQVIVYTDWEGRSPDLVEDQVTYPISTAFIAAPKLTFIGPVLASSSTSARFALHCLKALIPLLAQMRPASGGFTSMR